MDDSKFWELIDAARAEAQGDVEKQSTVLTRILSQFPVEEILGYEHRFAHYLDKAYDKAIWAAGSILEDLGDDDFHDFRAWLISRGKTAYFEVLKDPEKLAEIAEVGERVTSEEFNWVPGNAYEAKTGKDDFGFIREPPEIDQELRNASLSYTTDEGYADPERLRALYPRLFKKFGHRLNTDS